jgi:hypothetical protein
MNYLKAWFKNTIYLIIFLLGMNRLATASDTRVRTLGYGGLIPTRRLILIIIQLKIII